MKVALISDIHSNLFYLDAVDRELKKHKPDVVYCLGDIVGYYDAPGACIDWCISNNVRCIKGNHEKYLLNEIPPDPAKEPLYRSSLQRDSLTAEQLSFLTNLPDERIVSHGDRSFYLTHSLPGDCLNYVYDVNVLDKNFLQDYNYYCYGHTHIPMVRYHYGTAVVNPGSIGQPRDFSQQPSYAIVDLESDSVSLHKLKVDHQAYCRFLIDQAFEPNMVAVLSRTTK